MEVAITINHQELAKLVSTILDQDKAEEINTINLKGKTDIADYMVIANGRSVKHISALASKLVEGLKENGYKDVIIEGIEGSDWLVIDANTVIAHLFHPEARKTYDLDSMWQKQPANKPEQTSS